MSQRQHLRRRPSGTYAVRLVVPERLRRALGTREVQRSTGCRDLALAKIAAAQIVVHWRATIAALEHMDPDKIARGSVDLIGDGTLPFLEAAERLGADPIDLAKRLSAKRAPFLVTAEKFLGVPVDSISDLDLERDDFGHVTSVVADERALQNLGAPVPYTGPLAIHFDDDALGVLQTAGGHDVCLFRVPGPMQKAFVVPLPGVRLVPSQLQVQRRDVEAIRSAIAAALPADRFTLSAVPPELHRDPGIAHARHAHRRLSELTASYLKHRDGSWKADERRRQRDACAALVELTDDAELRHVDRERLTELARQLGRLPERRHRVHRQSAKAPGTIWNDWIALADERSLARVSAGTVERFMEDIAAVLGHGHRNGWLTQNPASGLAAEVFKSMGGKRRQQHLQRDLFDDSDLAVIFGVHWFKTGAGKLTAQGNYYGYRPHYYWLPLLGLFTGGRINELSQLYLDDIQQVDDCGWIIDFNLGQADKIDADDSDSGTDKSLKTVAAERVVPVHHTLIELGFVKFVEALRGEGHHRLFPELIHHPDKGYGKAPSSWFNERFMGRQLDIPRDGRKVFHSFRHTFSTALDRAGVPVNAAKQLIGHSNATNQGATAHYLKARTAVELRPEIDKLSFNLPKIAAFSVDEGIKAVRDALKLKSSRRSRSARKGDRNAQ